MKTTKVHQNLPTLTRLKLAFQGADSVPCFMFFLGYQQFAVARYVRKLIARSEWHRAWLSGYTGAGIMDVIERFNEFEDEIAQ